MFFRRHNASLMVRAPAKLNLYLEVLGKRPDGYHELETLMLKIDLYDDLLFSPGDDIRMSSDLSGLVSSGLWSRERIDSDRFDSPENLILRGAHLLREKTGTRRGASIRVLKRIPLESGLAGGSSDCASTLMALNELWELGLTNEELGAYSAELGSDIPFFFSPTSGAVCRGRGEVVEPLKVRQDLQFVIVRPKSGLSTASVFKQMKPFKEPRSIGPMCESWGGSEPPFGLSSRLFNRLQETAESLNPEVSRVREEFSRLPFIGHQMSGSGTSYFGICRSRREARRLANCLRMRGVGSVFVASTGI